MSKGKAWQTPVVIIGLIIVSALLTATWRTISSGLLAGGGDNRPSAATVDLPTEPSENVVLDMEGLFPSLAPDYFFQVEAIKNLDKQEFGPLQTLGFLTVVAFGGILMVGLLITGLVRMGDRSTAAMKADQDFIKATNNLTKAQQEYVRENGKAKPPTPKPSGVMPRWSALSTALVATFLAYFLGTVVSAGISEENSGVFTNILAILTFVVVSFLVRPNNVFDVDKTDYNRTPWSTIWVILSGALVLGLGMGFMFAVINGQNPFSFLAREWWDLNIIIPLTS